ncbi:hypothetical protein KSP39_PZI019101 [Platanthera zijinensis]|uniref:Reverse transcriptase Ty1/copia-type domain-containing protein n=1 Tax=Platanthera zijinensis TaxID=2320716 RepID=A0AAP0B1G2_9ASPA
MSRVPPHLHSVRAQILSSATTPSLSDVCSMLLKVTPPSEAPHDFAPALLQQPLLPNPPTRGSSTRGGRTPSRGRGRGGRSSMKCTYCGRDNHLEATCYCKHGLPPHLTATTSAAPTPTGPSAPDLASTTRQDIDELYTQLQQLQGALSRSSGSVASFSAEGITCLSHSPCWIVDSGATHHITSQKPTKYQRTPHPLCITVANGDTLPVSGTAALQLTPTLSLSSILHVPGSPFNLLSVSRLTHDLDCCITFSPSSFLMQDRRTRSTIGMGQLLNGLYILEIPPITLSAFSTVDWHRRLGHAPYRFSSGLFLMYLCRSSLVNPVSTANNIALPFPLLVPEPNGVAERKNRHLLDVVRSLMFQMQVPVEYWNFAVSTACHLINRLPSYVLNFASPLQLLYPSTNPTSLTPRVFGCVCYFHHLGPPSDKLAPRAAKYMFVGYFRTQKGYVWYSPSDGRLVVSADVTLCEHQPFHVPCPTSSSAPPLPRPAVPVTQSSLPSSSSSQPALPRVPPPLIRVYSRRPSKDTPVNQLPATSDTSATEDPAPVSTAHPLTNYVSLHRLTPPLYAFATSLSSISIPYSVQEALTHTGWWAAMKDEMRALWANQTWDLVPLPTDHTSARLVARGFTQQHDLDYEETFFLVAKLNTIRVLLSLVVHRHWPLYQLDIKNAFLNDDLQETVYMQQPPGFETTRESLVCHLRKSIYDLKQSPRAWFEKFSKVVRASGFTRSSADFSLFTRHRSTGTVILLVYVDDILITGNDTAGIQQIKEQLNSAFQTKDLGNLRYFLGLEVARLSDDLVLSQRKYCMDLLHDAGYSGCKPAETPMDANHKLSAHSSDSDKLLTNPKYYRCLVGKLIYLTVTRPDISFAVGVVSRFMHAPRTSHLQAVERILRYLKIAPGQGLVYKPSTSLSLVAYSDADYAGSIDDRRSTTGFCTYFGGHLITWRSKKQSMVARSSAEAEY